MKRSQVTPAVLAQDYADGASMDLIAYRRRVGKIRVRAAIIAAGLAIRSSGGHRGGCHRGRHEQIIERSRAAAEAGPHAARRQVVTAASGRIHALRAQVRIGGPLLYGPLTIAAAHDRRRSRCRPDSRRHP